MPHKNELGKVRHRHDQLGFGKTHHLPRGQTKSEHQHTFDENGVACCGQAGVVSIPDYVQEQVQEKKKADLTPYRLDAFDSEPDMATLTGGTWSTLVSFYQGGESVNFASGTWTRTDVAWWWSGVASQYGRVMSGPSSWDGNSNPPACGPSGSQSAWAFGEDYFECWFPYTVPTLPAGALGIMYTPKALNDSMYIYNDSHSYGSQEYGYQLRVATTLVDVRRGGELAGVFFGTKVNNPVPEVFIPLSMLPDAGQTVYIGHCPNWDTVMGDPINGPCWHGGSLAQNFDTLAMPATGSNLVSFRNETHVRWVGYDFEATSGWAGRAQAEDAWFDGNLPWSAYDQTDGAFSYANETLIFTPTTGTNGSGYIQMDGASEVDMPDGFDEPAGEPWTEDDGVRMLVRFKISAVGSLVDSGTRASDS